MRALCIRSFTTFWIRTAPVSMLRVELDGDFEPTLDLAGGSPLLAARYACVVVDHRPHAGYAVAVKWLTVGFFAYVVSCVSSGP